MKYKIKKLPEKNESYYVQSYRKYKICYFDFVSFNSTGLKVTYAFNNFYANLLL